MTPEKRHSILKKSVKPGEKFLHGLYGYSMPDFGWYFVIGPAMFFMMKFYMVGISSKALYFHRMNYLSKVIQVDRFSNAEIDEILQKRSWLSTQLDFYFTNGRSLKLNVSRAEKLKHEAGLLYLGKKFK